VIISIVTQAQLAKNWGLFFSLSDWLWFSSFALVICHYLSLSFSHSVHNILQNHVLFRCTTVEFTWLEDSMLTKIETNRAVFRRWRMRCHEASHIWFESELSYKKCCLYKLRHVTRSVSLSRKWIGSCEHSLACILVFTWDRMNVCVRGTNRMSCYKFGYRIKRRPRRKSRQIPVKWSEVQWMF